MLRFSRTCLVAAMLLAGGGAQASATYSYVFDVKVDRCMSADTAVCNGFTPREFEQTWLLTAPLVSTYARLDLGVYIQDSAVTRAEGVVPTATPFSQSFVDAGLFPAVTPQSWFHSGKISTFTPDDVPLSSNFIFSAAQREIAPIEDENQNWVGTNSHATTLYGSRALDPVRHFDRPYSANDMHRMLPTLGPLSWGESGWRSFDDGRIFGFAYLGTATLQSVVAISPVPEPETYAMYLAGLLFLVFAVRHRAGPGAGHALSRNVSKFPRAGIMKALEKGGGEPTFGLSSPFA